LAPDLPPAIDAAITELSSRMDVLAAESEAVSAEREALPAS
jgi:hypothetical protein